MAAAAVALAQLLQTCAPNVGERTMTAIVRVESGGNYLAIRDNDVNRTFSPVDVREGVAWSMQLLRLHHSIDLGIAQINSANLDKLGMSLSDAFDPCINIHGGATILSFDYGLASRQFGPGQFALRRAIGAYNSGSIFAGESYVNRILVAAGVRSDADVHVPDLRSIGAGSDALAASPRVRPLPLSLTVPKRRSLEASAAVQSAPLPPSYGAPILVPVGTEASSGTSPQSAAILQPAGPVIEQAGSAPALVAAPTPAPSSSPSKPGVAILPPFGSPIVLNVMPALLPSVVRGVNGLPQVAPRPGLLVNMTLGPSPSPSPAAATTSR